MAKKCNIGVRAVIKDNNKYLLVQRAKSSSRPHYWEFPGGKTDCKEHKSSIKREVKEEINLNMKNPKFIKQKRDGKFWVRYYKGKVTGNVKLQKSEVDGIGYFTPKQAKKLKLTNHTRMLI